MHAEIDERTVAVRRDEPVTVSAVIPTRNRPGPVVSAVLSALTQTLRSIEVIVVIDGPDPMTEVALATIGDPRLHVVTLPASGGPAGARNRGVQLARGEWVAFLDDDDQWAPEKLFLQLEAAHGSGVDYPIVSCRVVARTSSGDHIWPKHLPGEGEHLSDYLLDRRRPFSRAGFIATPTLFAKRELLLRTPMPHYMLHEDWGWLLTVTRRAGVKLVVLEQALCTVNVDDQGASLHNRNDWEGSLKWLRDHAEYVAPTAYAAFVSTKIAIMARRRGAWHAMPKLLFEAVWIGKPKPWHLVMFLGVWIVPRHFDKTLRNLSFRSAVRTVPRVTDGTGTGATR